MKVIANTTILSNFAAAGRLDVLRRLLGELHISTDVYAEIQDGLVGGPSSPMMRVLAKPPRN